MILLGILKLILALINTGIYFAFRFVWTDFNNVRKQADFDLLTIWQRIKFLFQFYSIIFAFAVTFLFLVYFIIVPMHASFF